MSNRFYSDLLPPNVIRRPPHPRIDELSERLSRLPNLYFVDAIPILRHAQASRRIYHKTDFHWNDAAAFDVAKVFVDEMSQVDGHDSPWNHHLQIDHKRISGGIALFMPLFSLQRRKAYSSRRHGLIRPGTRLLYFHLHSQKSFHLIRIANCSLLPFFLETASSTV